MTDTPSAADALDLNQAIQDIKDCIGDDTPDHICARDALERILQSLNTRAAAPQEVDKGEWFFRWVARGKAGYADMALEQCIDMIWHHPDNPYRENNPWDEQRNLIGKQG